MSKKILIVGDSWGCGEWDLQGDQYLVTHKGLEHFLSKEHLVQNSSEPSESNIIAVDIIKKYHKNFDTIIWVVTQPSRDFERFNYFYGRSREIFLIADNNQPFIEQCKTAIYNRIEEVHSLCGTKVIMVGGFHKIDQEYHAGFKKVINWVDLLNGLHLKTYYIGPQIYKEVYFPINFKVDDDDNEKRQQFNNHMYSTREFFYPDGVHPNRKGHEILYNNIKDYI